MYYLGVDVGGTNLVAGLVDETGRLLAKAATPTEAQRPPEALCCDILRLCREAAAAAQVDRTAISYVGMGIPGSVDRDRGIVLETPNAPFHNTALSALFRQEWDIPVYLENDGNCAALGEYYLGAARGSHSAIVLTLGTGIGGGILEHDRLVLGENGVAGEVGHMVVELEGLPCNCGRQGCWEQYASASGLIRMTRKAAQAHPDSVLAALSARQLDGRTAFAALAAGDETGKNVVDRYLRYLAAGITNLVNIFQPQLICLGGGVSNAEDSYLLYPLRQLVAQENYCRVTAEQTKIVKATLGNDAGILGAAYLGKQAGTIETKSGRWA